MPAPGPDAVQARGVRVDKRELRKGRVSINLGVGPDLDVVRERLVEGDSDAQVVDFIVARYGEFVLLKPTVGGSNWLLWAAGPLMLLAALGVGIVYIRGRGAARAPQEEALSVEEQARLKEILRE